MVSKTVDVRYEAGMRLVARTGTGHEVAFDDGEGDSAARPTEVVLSALAACTAMDVVSIMAKKRQPFEAYVVHVSGTQRDAYPQVFTRIDVVHEVIGDGVDTAQVRRCIELSATKYCPVNAMLSAGDTEVHHGYRVLRSPDASEAAEVGEVLVTGPHWQPVLVER